MTSLILISMSIISIPRWLRNIAPQYAREGCVAWWPRPRQLSCSLQSHPGLPPIPPLIGLSLFIRGLSIFIRSLSLYKRPLPNSDPLSQTAQNHCSTSIGVKKEVSASIASCVSQLPHTLKSDTLVRVSPRNTLPSLFEPHLWSRLVTESEHLTTQVFVG